jgi:hypothetical protein
MLQAVILAIADLQDPISGSCPIDALQARLEQYPALADRANTWLLIAAQERLFFLRQTTPGMFSGQLYLEHPLVQKALQIRPRVLCVLDILQRGREWVAFGVAEKALTTLRPLAESQSLRHAWLELLVAQGFLQTERVTRPDGAAQVTTLRLSRDNQASAALLRYQTTPTLTRLIVVMSDFMAEKAQGWISLGTLLERLTGPLALIEVRSLINAAQEQELITSETLTGARKGTIKVFSLRTDHALVKETLARRDLFLKLARATFTARNLAAGQALLVEIFTREGHVSRADALFWIALLSDEGLFSQERLALGSGESTSVFALNLQHPVLDQMFTATDASVQKREVNE